jgi:hypothetical protein
MRQRHNLLANQVLYVACQLEETSFSFNATPEFLCDLGINDASFCLALDLSAEIKSEGASTGHRIRLCLAVGRILHLYRCSANEGDFILSKLLNYESAGQSSNALPGSNNCSHGPNM